MRDEEENDLETVGCDAGGKNSSPCRCVVRLPGLFFHPSSFIPCVLALAVALGAVSCTLKASREGIPPQAQTTIDTVSDDITEGRYEKIYHESAEEWQRTSTPEQNNAFFKTLKTKLGSVKSRSFHTAREEHNTGGPVPGHSFTITYQTSFERAEGMETFTLLERDGRWLLAGYFVNSNALKQ